MAACSLLLPLPPPPPPSPSFPQMCCLHKRVAEQAELQARLMKRFATLSLDVDALECGLEDRTGPQLSSLAGL